MPLSTSLATKSAISGICSVARTIVGCSMPIMAESSRSAFSYFCRVLLNADAIARGVADDLVVHVGDVHDMVNFVSALAQESAEEIDGDEGAEIADMAVVVNRRSAGVHADFVVAQRTELLDLRRHRVVQAKGHRMRRKSELKILGCA